MGESNKCVDCGFELDYSDEDIPQCFRCDSQEWRRMCDKLTDRDTQIIEHNVYLTAERDKYRDACERLVATGANLVKVIEAATVIETMFVMGNRKDKAFQEVEQIVGAKNLLKWQLADAADLARQVKAELEGIEGSEIEVGVE